MCSKPLSLYDQGLASLFANKNECYQSVGLIDVEKTTRYLPNNRSSRWATGFGRSVFICCVSASGSAVRYSLAVRSNKRPCFRPNQRKSAITDSFSVIVQATTRTN